MERRERSYCPYGKKRQTRYLINFADHESNHVRVFVAKFKDEAARNVPALFMTFFGRQFNVRVHVFRKDGGGEYRNLDLFYEQTGVGRQTSASSNGKAERMHRTVRYIWFDACSLAADR